MQSYNSIQGVFKIYRLALSGLLVVSIIFIPGSAQFSGTNTQLFFYCSLIWFALSLLSAVLDRKIPDSEWTQTTNLGIDMLALSVLSWAGGGLGSGLTYLMLPSAAIAGLMLRAQLALFIAAIASISILTGQFLLFLNATATMNSLFPAGLLGAMLFACTAAFKILETRLYTTELRAEESDAKASEYLQLSEVVIAQMVTGVLVVDELGQVTLSNPSAERMLTATNSLTTTTVGLSLERFENLHKRYMQWKSDPESLASSFTHRVSGLEIRPRFKDLSQKGGQRTLIMLEDTHQIRQQAQQAKVFALGKLSTSLAHEVRNPLSAINQANDLLQSSENLDAEERGLVEIIGRHCERMDKTITVANQLSKQLKPDITQFSLHSWLSNFVNEYQEAAAKACDIHIKLKESAKVSFDPQHLSQVLRNLVDNGLRYSEEACGKRDVAILVSNDRAKRLLFIDVHDRGLGIPKEESEKVFEPFYSQSGSTGVGLYLSRELCDANFASLNYLYKSESQESGFFRVTAWVELPNR